MHQTKNPAAYKRFLQSIYEQALQPALPKNALADFQPPKVEGRTFLLAAGKAATQMAAAVVPKLGDGLEGLVITRTGYCQPGFGHPGLEIVEASHPVPDSEGLAAAQKAVDAAQGLSGQDLLLALVSGGASALLPMPAPGISLEEKQQVTRQLLRSGAPISKINIVRKHLSGIKGGRLAAAAYPASTVMIAISDVPGDDLGTIGSGPTVADASTLADARAIIEEYGIEIPATISTALNNPDNETPKEDDLRLSRVTSSICAAPADLVKAAAAAVRALGYEPRILGDDLEGEARDLGRHHASLALQLRTEGKKVALISGGETSVTMTNPNGRGGRNTAFLLSCALALEGANGIIGFAADTDGIDGSEDHAGAFLWPGVLSAMGGPEKALQFLDSDESYCAFQAADGLMMTGPSGTNVNDLRVLLIG